MSLFEQKDYRKIIRDRLECEAQRGTQTKLAKALSIHTTTLSQIISGVKPMSLETAALLCDFFSFTELESEYFITLVQYSRAGNPSLKARFEKQIEKLQSQSMQLSKVLPAEKSLSLKEQVIFYSDWKYSAVRVLSSIPGLNDVNSIAERLAVPKQSVLAIVEFLLEHGLCIEKKGKLLPGPSYTHLPSTSPLIAKHHSNLRLKAMNHHSNLSEKDLSYSSLISFSRSDVKKVRALIVKLLEQVNRTREDTEPETIQLLNLDWIEI